MYKSLLICAVDYSQFKKFQTLDEQTLCNVEKEFGDIVFKREQEVKNERIECLMDSNQCSLEWAKILARGEEQEWLKIIRALPETTRIRIKAAKEAALRNL